MSDFSYRPKTDCVKTWSEMGRERYERELQEGAVSYVTEVQCEVCTRRLTQKVVAYSRKYFGKMLCFGCQETERLISS